VVVAAFSGVELALVIAVPGMPVTSGTPESPFEEEAVEEGVGTAESREESRGVTELSPVDLAGAFAGVIVE
jgi:hypothetical protein